MCFTFSKDVESLLAWHLWALNLRKVTNENDKSNHKNNHIIEYLHLRLESNNVLHVCLLDLESGQYKPNVLYLGVKL